MPCILILQAYLFFCRLYSSVFFLNISIIISPLVTKDDFPYNIKILLNTRLMQQKEEMV